MDTLERKLAKYSGNIIRTLRKERNWTQKDLGEKVGVSASAIANYEKGFRAPLQNTLFALADAFDISVNDFFPDTKKAPSTLDQITEVSSTLHPDRQQNVLSFAKKQKEEQETIQEDAPVYKLSDYTDVQVYGAVSAGRGQYVYDEPVETIGIHTADLPDASYDIILKVVGDSMEPAFQDGDYIFVKRTSEIANGSFGVFVINGESYLKKVYVEDNQMRLVSLNSNYDDLIFKENDDIKFIGKVVF